MNRITIHVISGYNEMIIKEHNVPQGTYFRETLEEMK